MHAGERRTHAGEVVPPIVIAEDRPGSERGLKPRQFGRPQRIGNRLELEMPVPSLEIAKQHDEVGLQSLRRVDDALNVRQRHVGTAGMQVGDHRDGKFAAARASAAASAHSA